VKRLLYVQFTNPAAYPPLEHSSRMAADDGWEVVFLGTGAFGAGSLTFRPHPRITEKRLPSLPGDGRQWLRYIYFTAWVLAWVLVWRPRRVYASDFLTCPIALLLTFVPGLKVIYHEHDSPPSGTGDITRQACLVARRHLARRAARCVLPNTTRAERFARELRALENTVCVWNCPAREEVAPPRAQADEQSLWVLYHGSIVPSRLPPTVVTALAKLPASVKLRVIGYQTVGHFGYVDQLRAMASELGVAERVEYVGAVPTRAELLDWTRRSDVGIAFMPKVALGRDDHAMVGASNKPFDYLANGVPLLVADLPDWRSLYVDPGYGLACDPEDPDSIAAALEWFLTHPAERHAMGERGRQRVGQEWNYEAQFAPVYDELLCTV
jgi:glycosyltransferase involved in cell wall biosynthesis